MELKRQIGVDFGTTTSVVCYRDFGEDKCGDVKFIEFGSDKTLYTPTCILKKGEYTGRKGKKRSIQKEKYGWEAYYNTLCYELLETDFKMKLLSKNPEERAEAQKWTKKFIAYLYEAYCSGWVSNAGTALEEINTYVTYPNQFQPEIQQFLKKAAEEAGFPNVIMISEAVAAMHYAVTHDNKKSVNLLQTSKGKQNIMLIDMGAGTTDIAVFEYDRQVPESLRVLSNGLANEKKNFGGREIDDILCEFYKNKIHPDLAREIGTSQGGDERLGEVLLRDWVKKFKENILSGCLTADEYIEDEMPGNLFSYAEKYCSDYSAMEFNRDRFESIHKEYLAVFPKMIDSAVNQACLQGRDIDFVLLTGGHSRWYFVKEILCGELSCLDKIKEDSARVISYDENANYVVAAGATYYGNIPEPEKKTEPKPRFEEPPKYIEETISKPKAALCNYDCLWDFWRKCNNCHNCDSDCSNRGWDNCAMDDCIIWCERDC